MTDSGNTPTRSPAVFTWTVEGVKHDRVERFYPDPETGGTAVQCYHDCCCKKKKKET